MNVFRIFALARLRFLRESSVASEKVYHSASELVYHVGPNIREDPYIRCVRKESPLRCL